MTLKEIVSVSISCVIIVTAVVCSIKLKEFFGGVSTTVDQISEMTDEVYGKRKDIMETIDNIYYASGHLPLGMSPSPGGK